MYTDYDAVWTYDFLKHAVDEIIIFYYIYPTPLINTVIIIHFNETMRFFMIFFFFRFISLSYIIKSLFIYLIGLHASGTL